MKLFKKSVEKQYNPTKECESFSCLPVAALHVLFQIKRYGDQNNYTLCTDAPLPHRKNRGERPQFFFGKIGGNKEDYMESIMNNLPPLPFRF